ncbi:MAG: energy-coupling factor transporter transmembrane protein EcfT [Methanocellales archaeon]|nr:energy-coupling factor transporter transmembrane protein EcfT [Methanocellales archaeon]
MERESNLLEKYAGMNSMIHRVDPSVKLIAALILIITTVASNTLSIPLMVGTLLLVVSFTAKLPLKYILKRVSIVMPFAGPIAVLQPFLREGYAVASLLGHPITYEGIYFGALLIAKVMVSVLSIIILSSTTTTPDLMNGAKRLYMPKELVIIFSLMLRYMETESPCLDHRHSIHSVI